MKLSTAIKNRLENGDKFNVGRKMFAGKLHDFWLECYYTDKLSGKKSYAISGHCVTAGGGMNVSKITKMYMYLYTYDLLGNPHNCRVYLDTIKFVNE